MHAPARAWLASAALAAAACGCGTTGPAVPMPDPDPEIYIRAPLERVRDAIADGMIRSGWHADAGSQYGQAFVHGDYRVGFSLSYARPQTFVRAQVSRQRPPKLEHPGELRPLRAEIQSFLERLRFALEAAEPAEAAPQDAPPPEPAPPPSRPALPARPRKLLKGIGL